MEVDFSRKEQKDINAMKYIHDEYQDCTLNTKTSYKDFK